jgi:hypothetical protein
MLSQLGIIKSHIDDAIAKGAKVALGGPDAVGERFVQPTILTHVPEDSTEITEETFGPPLAITQQNRPHLINLTSFPRTAKADCQVTQLITQLHGGKNTEVKEHRR